jgi:hypothetical protein
LRIYRRISGKKYLCGKAVYRYEQLYIPVPKRFQGIVKPFLGQDLKIKIEPDKDGFMTKTHISSRPKQTKKEQNIQPRTFNLP